jgi:SAM-dependent methyltransferase
VRELTGIDSQSVAELPKVRSGVRLRVYDTQPAFWAERCAYPVPSLLAKCDWIDVRTSIYDPGRSWGEAVGPKITNQNLEQLTFQDGEFDIVITSDVMEHVRLADRAHREIRRVLRPGGVYLMTVPHVRDRHASLERVRIVDPRDPSQDQYPLPRVYDGDANSQAGRSLVYRIYGTQLDQELQSLGFTVDYDCEDRPEQGIVNTELFYCRVRGT